MQKRQTGALKINCELTEGRFEKMLPPVLRVKDCMFGARVSVRNGISSHTHALTDICLFLFLLFLYFLSRSEKKLNYPHGGKKK